LIQNLHITGKKIWGNNPETKFTDNLRTILRQFSDLRQSYDLS